MNREQIAKFADKNDKKKVQEFYEISLGIITHALGDMIKLLGPICHLTPENTRIFPMGDYTNDTFIDQTGELEVVVASSDPQLAIANELFAKSYAKAKTKKEREAVSNSGTFDQILTIYPKMLAPYFDETTSIFATQDGVKILCLKEYSFKILVRFATYSELDKSAKLSFWDAVSHKSKEIDLFKYNELMDKKNKKTRGNYKKLVRIFKNIRKTILINKWAMSSDLNKYFVELVAYNIPDNLLMGDDIVAVFYNAVNYLDNVSILSFKDFEGGDIRNFALAKISPAKIHNFIKQILKIAL